MKKVTIIISACFILVLNCCEQPKPKYGFDFNAERKAIGLPIIPSNWKPDVIKNSYEIWRNPEGQYHKVSTPYHKEKSVHYNKNGLEWESDKYVGKTNYITIDGIFKENLYIIYNFQGVLDQDSTNWECTIYNQSSVDEGATGKNITLQEAEEILEEWGIERLNY